jgi:hypothetical protein
VAHSSRFSGSLTHSVRLLNRYAPLIGFAGIIALATVGQRNWFIKLRDLWNAETLWRQEQAVPPWMPPPRTLVVHVPLQTAVLGAVDRASDTFNSASLVAISGWVGTTQNGSKIKAVVVSVNGKAVGKSRQLRQFAFSDVLFDRADFVPLGWSVQFDASEVPAGNDHFAAAALLADGTTQTFASWPANRAKPR